MYVRGDGNDNLNCVSTRPAPGLPRPYFGAGLPDPDLDRGDAGSLDDRPGRAVPAAGERRGDQADHAPLPTFTADPTPTRPDADADADPAADPDADPDAQPDADSRRPAPRRPRRRPPPDAHAEPTPTQRRPGRGPAAAVGRRRRRERRRRWEWRPGGGQPSPAEAVDVVPARGRPADPRRTRWPGPPARASAARSASTPAPHPWWTPVRVVLAVAALAFVLGMVQKTPCVRDDWAGNDAPVRRDVLLRRALPLHRSRLRRAATCPTPTTAERYPAMEYPVVIGYFAYGAALVTQALGGPPGPDAAPGRLPGDQIYGAARRRAQESRPLLPGHGGAAGAVRAAGRLVPGRGAPAAALGRDAVRRLARPWCWPAWSTGTSSRSPPWRARCGPGRAAGRCSPGC